MKSTVFEKIFILILFVSIGLNFVFIPSTFNKQTPPPETIIEYRIDTVLKTIEKEVFINNPTPVTPNSKDTTTNLAIYSDTIQNEQIDLIVNSSVKGVLQEQTFKYKLKYPEISKTQLIKTTEFKEIPKYNTGLYLTGTLGLINSHTDLLIGFVLLPKKGRFLYAYNYGLSSRMHLFSIGYRF